MEFPARRGARFFAALSLILSLFSAALSAEPLTLVGQWNVPLPEAPDRRTQAVGNREYRALGSVGLQILDISIPAQPVVLGTYRDPLGRALAVVVTNDLAFVAYGERELQIINVANPASPFRVNGFYAANRPPGGGYGTPAVVASDLALAGNLVYLADGLSGLQIVNVSEPSNPVSVGIYETVQSAVSVAVKGTNATVLAGPTAYDLDVSNPAAPRLLKATPTIAQLHSIAIDGSIIVAGLDFRGVEVIDVSNPAAPVSLGSLELDSWVNDVAVDGDVALVAHYSYGARVLDLSDPAAPRIAATFPTERNAFGVALVGTRGYVAAYSDLYILDLSNLEQPRQLGRYRAVTPCHRVTVVNHLAFIDGANEGPVDVVNVADPANPVSLGNLPVRSMSSVVRDNVLFAASDEGLKVFEVSNPSAPRLLGTSADPGNGFRDIAVQGSYVFKSNNGGVLTVFELTDQNSPIPVPTATAAGSTYSIVTDENYVYAANYRDGLKIFRNEKAGLRLEAAPLGQSAGFRVLNGTPNGQYVLERTTGLAAPAVWSPIATNVLQSYTGSFPTAGSGGDRGFFRLRKAR